MAWLYALPCVLDGLVNVSLLGVEARVIANVDSGLAVKGLVWLDSSAGLEERTDAYLQSSIHVEQTGLAETGCYFWSSCMHLPNPDFLGRK